MRAQQLPAAREAPTAATSPAPKASGTQPAAESKPAGDGELLSFDQSKVSAQMSELEERMFRLAESLRELEPENSSRLRLGLRYAREELILHQMQLAQEMLSTLKLTDAVTEEKDLLAKLERLHDLLLSADLDFQIRLEQLRQIRAVLRQLDTAIKEEDRERKLSEGAAEKQQRLARLRRRQVTLEELIRRQADHVGQGKKLAGPSESTGADAGRDRKALRQLAREQSRTREKTKALAEEREDAGGVSEHLRWAEGAMARAGVSLGKAGIAAGATDGTRERDPGGDSALDKAEVSEGNEGDAGTAPKPGDVQAGLVKEAAASALPHQEQALQSLEKELQRTVGEAKRMASELSTERFSAMRKDQAGNRGLTDSMSQSVRKLGDAGAGALGELIRGSGSMASAEDELGGRQAGQASTHQDRALQSLKYARDQLEREAERLQEALRAEVKRRVTEGLTAMLEKQVAVREATESLGPRIQEGSREALTSLVALAKSEEKIIAMADELVALCEETEFAIALPAALRVVRRSMVSVQTSLAGGDASEQVVTAERQIEADLQALLEAMKQMPTTGGSRPGRGQRSPQERERELNRLVAELKMIRMLQVRVNGETVDVDGRRAAELEALSAAIRKGIEGVEQHQDEVRDAMERLAEQRSP